jgi:hypothetical protein
MAQHRRIYGLGLAAAGLILGLLLAGAGTIRAQAAGGGPRLGTRGQIAATGVLTACLAWNVVPSDNAQSFDSYLYGVAATAANDIWAVGNYQDGDGYQHTLTEHWNGSAWTVVSSPDPGAHNNRLFGVAALAPDNAWAVGWQASTNIPQPLFLQWDGTAWNEVPQTLARPQVVLDGIAAVAPNDIWAVGRSCETPQCLRRVTAAAHFDGTAWSVVNTPNPGSYDNAFHAVAAVASNDVWAVGESCSDAGCATAQALLEHWDGTQWTVLPSPYPAGSYLTLSGVSGLSGTDAWAVGENCPDATCLSVALHWDGAQWHIAGSPNPGTADTHLNAVAMVAPQDVWAAGSASNDGTVYQDVLLHWDGTGWSTTAVTSPGATDNDLRGLVPVSAANVWAVGDAQNSGGPERTQTQQYTGSCPTTTPTATVEPPTATSTAVPPTASSTAVPPTASSTAVPPTRTATPSSTPCLISFSDVHPADYFYMPVQYLSCQGIVSGYGDGSFRPYANTTRGQLAKIVVRAQGWPLVTPPSGPTFGDVPASHPFYAVVETAYAHGIIAGYTCGPGCLQFHPGAAVTRAQLTKIVVLAQGWTLTAPAQPTFRDVPASDPFYRVIETAYDHGIVAGYGDGTFRPGAATTRGQIVKIVYGAVSAP